MQMLLFGLFFWLSPRCLLSEFGPPDFSPPEWGVADDQDGEDDRYIAPAEGERAERSWERVPVEDGNAGHCSFCGAKVDLAEGGAMILHRGRTVHLCAKEACHEHWASAPEQAFRVLQPKAGLWDESVASPGNLASVWMLLGLWVLAGLICGSGAAYLAIGRGHPPMPWFFIGLGINVLGLLLVLTRPAGRISGPQGVPGGLCKVPLTRAPQPCPACPAANHPSASECSSCGAKLIPTAGDEVRPS